MKSNNLLEGIETDIKIEKGLKILQFGTQFFIHRSYLRNCPIIQTEDDHDSDAIRRKDEKSKAIAQLNDFLINPSSHFPKYGLKGEMMSVPIPKSPSPQSQESKSKYSPESSVGKSRAKLSIKHNTADSPESRREMKEIDKLIQVKQTPKTLKTTNAASPSSQLNKKQEEAKVSLSKKIAKIAETPKIKKSVQIQEEPEYLGSSKTSKISSELSVSLSSSGSKRGKKGGDFSKEIKEDDLVSYHSSVRHMSIIREADESRENVSGQFRKQKSRSGYDLSDFQSIKLGNSFENTSFLPKNGPNYLREPQKVNRSAQADIKSQSNSFLDRSISQIKSSSKDRTFISESKINQTELNLLRQISESFADEQNIKYLLKLQNFEMEEKYVLQRMEKRFQTCTKDINSIRSIDWTSLQMGTTQITFKRPNYAHCLETLR